MFRDLDKGELLSLGHRFIPEGRFASLLVRDTELAGKLSSGFNELWTQAMSNLSEIRFHPRTKASAGG